MTFVKQSIQNIRMTKENAKIKKRPIHESIHGPWSALLSEGAKYQGEGIRTVEAVGGMGGGHASPWKSWKFFEMH